MKIEWIEIPAGEFLMGLSQQQVIALQRQLPPGQDFRHAVDLESETVQRVVYLDTFWIARNPITYGQYNEFVASGHPYADPEGLRKQSNFIYYPMNSPEPVIWHNAMAFCAWLGGRLPTAAEWEKAARGTDGRLYPWGNEWDLSHGNFSRYQEIPRSRSWLTDVDSFPGGVSPYGVWEMMGNVREWTLTFEYDSVSKQEVPVVKGSCAEDGPPPDWFTHRVTRHRKGSLIPIESPPYTGFRPVMDRWQRQHWPGFQSEATELSKS